MKIIRKYITPLLITLLVLGSFAGPAAAEDGYFRQMGYDLWRGLRNVISAPAEIPVAMQEHLRNADNPALTGISAGFTDGFFRMLERWGSGAWDFVAAFIPGQQEGIPVEPETLF